MKKLSVILSILLLISCGSRKSEINKQEKQSKIEQSETLKNDVVIDANIKIENTTKIDSVKNEIIEETIIEADDKTKPAYHDGKELGNTKTTKRKTTRNKASSIQNNINTSINEKSADKTIKTSQKKEQTKEAVKTKTTNREFSIFSYLWILILIIIIWYLYKKYKNIIFV